MKKTVLIVAFAACMALVSGCDFFRGIAGRPTSADIAVKREALEKEAALKEQARLDSIAAVNAARKAVEDSLAATARLVGTPKYKLVTRKFDPATAAAIDRRYYVVVGTFGTPSNATGLAARLEAAGFKAVLLRYRDGSTAVAVNPTDRIAEAEVSLGKVTALDFIHSDSLIIDVSAL